MFNIFFTLIPVPVTAEAVAATAEAGLEPLTLGWRGKYFTTLLLLLGKYMSCSLMSGNTTSDQVATLPNGKNRRSLAPTLKGKNAI
jgi:hypothetical protein